MIGRFFKFITDPIRKHQSVRYAISSVLAWVVDNVLYYVMLIPFGAIAALGAVAASSAAQVLARVLSSFFNFNMNNFFVFKSCGDYKQALIKYYCLCIPQAAVSVLLLDVMINGLVLESNLLKLGIKIVIEAVLFVLSYFIQHKWVFIHK